MAARWADAIVTITKGDKATYEKAIKLKMSNLSNIQSNGN